MNSVSYPVVCKRAVPQYLFTIFDFLLNLEKEIKSSGKIKIGRSPLYH